MQLGQVLPVLQALEQVAPRPFLPVGERFENLVPFEQPRNVGQAGLQARLRADGCHGDIVARVISPTRYARVTKP